MNTRTTRRLVAVSLSLAVPFAFIHPATAVTPTDSHDGPSFSVLGSTPDHQEQSTDPDDVEQALDLIQQIPDDVLSEGDRATSEWINTHGVTATRASVLGCTGSILSALGGAIIPAWKLVKIKRLIKSLGGVRKAVEEMRKVGFKFDKMEAAGGALAALGAELLGIKGISDNCFN